MHPKDHLIISVLFAIFLFLIIPSVGVMGVAIIILFGFFVDVDHYFFYAFKKRDFNLKKAYDWFIAQDKKIVSLPFKQREKLYVCICFFHGFEFIIIFFLLGLFLNEYFLFASIGLLVHFILDLCGHFPSKLRFYRISIIYASICQSKLKFIDA